MKILHANSNKEDLGLIILSNKIALRIKKLDRNKKSRNNNTRQTRSFLWQNLELDLLDEVPTYCDLGYQLDSTGTQIKLISIVCRLGKAVAWEYKITSDKQETITSQSHLYEEEPVTKKKRISAIKPELKEQKKIS
jgi:hypothetical protein